MLFRLRGPWLFQQPERPGSHILSLRLGIVLSFCQEVFLFIRYNSWPFFFRLVFMSILYEISVAFLKLEITKWNLLIKKIFPIKYICSVSANICTAIKHPNSQKKRGLHWLTINMFTYLCGRFWYIYIYIYIWNSIMFNLLKILTISPLDYMFLILIVIFY